MFIKTDFTKITHTLENIKAGTEIQMAPKINFPKKMAKK
jgi:hypothetical protein